MSSVSDDTDTTETNSRGLYRAAHMQGGFFGRQQDFAAFVVHMKALLWFPD